MNQMASMKPAYPTVTISRLRVPALLLACLLLSSCSRFLFFPMQPWTRTPAALGIEYEDVEIISTDDTRLSAWWLEAYGDVQGTVVFFHGNAENISTHLGSVYWLPEQGYQVLMVDYRGYGRSEGKASVDGAMDDINATLNYALGDPRVVGKPVFVLGQSLGATMGGYVVAAAPELNSQLTGVVLDAGFASYPEITREIASRYWFTWALQYPASWTMPRRYNLIDHVADISPTPLLIIHGTKDEIVPFSNGEELFAAAEQPKNFLLYDGLHIQSFRDIELRQMMLDFFAMAEAGEAGSISQTP